jgi:hypothetical protein
MSPKEQIKVIVKHKNEQK